MEQESGLQELCAEVIEALDACRHALDVAQEEQHASFAHLVYVLGSMQRRIADLEREAMLHWLAGQPELRQELRSRLRSRLGVDHPSGIGEVFELSPRTRGRSSPSARQPRRVAHPGVLRELRPSDTN